MTRKPIGWAYEYRFSPHHPWKTDLCCFKPEPAEHNCNIRPVYDLPDGWKMVPLEATVEMLKAGYGEHWKWRYRHLFRRMLDAAPHPPAATVGPASSISGDHLAEQGEPEPTWPEHMRGSALHPANRERVTHIDGLTAAPASSPSGGHMAEQGEPVAWMWEEQDIRTDWQKHVSIDRPEESQYRRRVQPLYGKPSAPNVSDQGSVNWSAESPVMAETSKTARLDLGKLSRDASQGEWSVERMENYGTSSADRFFSYGIECGQHTILDTLNSSGGVLEQEHDEDLTTVWDEQARRDLTYIAALVNAHRSGQLVLAPADALDIAQPEVRHG